MELDQRHLNYPRLSEYDSAATRHLPRPQSSVAEPPPRSNLPSPSSLPTTATTPLDLVPPPSRLLVA
jgi:hypothetical protein